MKRYSHDAFLAFLEKIDLDAYRARFQSTKTVEMDLPKKLQTLETIYAQYWDNADGLRALPLFDDYFEQYYKEKKSDFLAFAKKTGYGTDCDCFLNGLKARTYRTWAALLTQIQAGYLARELFGENCVQMSAELDYEKTDILLLNPDGTTRAKIQVKKETHRKEIARMQKNLPETTSAEQDKTKYLFYSVPSQKDYDNPFYKQNTKTARKGDIKSFARAFVKYNPTSGTLKRLPNGFTIFTENAFREF